MKKYIFLTFAIQRIGGGQCYVASKAKYLEELGWTVFVFSGGSPKSKTICPIPYLDKYRPNMLLALDYPLHKLPRCVVDKSLKSLMRMIGDVSHGEEIVIESHHDTLALWGELLAKKIHARHVFFALTEHYRKKGLCYEEKIDFFMKKFDRGEILCNYTTANRLFEGYRTFKESDIEAALLDEEPVQDVSCPLVESLKQLDYNICYIGRADKPYVPNILAGVRAFAERHSGNAIQLVLVGDMKSVRELLINISTNSTNLSIIQLGPLHPLPSSLFRIVDVVIAGSGSARCSVEHGALTILADPESKMSMGLLGYDTNDSVFNSKGVENVAFDRALEKALIEKDYLNKPFNYPAKVGVEACTQQNFMLISKADKTLSYYDERKLRQGKVDIKLCLRLMRDCLFAK